MANYTAVRAKSQTLTAGTVDVVQLDQSYRAVEVINRDTAADLWVTIDRQPGNATSITPTVAGDSCYYVGPGGVRILIDDAPNDSASPVSQVRLISAAAIAYTVTGHM